MNSFASVSLSPPLVLWSLAVSATSLPLFRAARYHAINVLGAEQRAMASRFASRQADRFAGSDWRTGPFDAVLLEGARSHLVCDLRDAREAGDHVILLCEMIYHRRNEGAPLIFHAGAFATTAALPDCARRSPSAA